MIRIWSPESGLISILNPLISKYPIPYLMAHWSYQTTQTAIRGFSDDPGLKRDLKMRRLKIAAVILLLLAGIGASARPAYRAFRTHQIDGNLEAAQAAAREQDWGTARNLARSVLLARSNDFDAFRVWFRALSEMGEPRTYLAAAQLFSDSRSTHDDRMDALRVMSLQAPQALALSAYGSLEPDLKYGAEARAALTEVLLLRGEIELAEKMLRETPDLNEYPQARLALLRVLCARPDPDRVEEARELFVGLIEDRQISENPEGLDGLRALGQVPGGLADGDPLPPLIPWVNRQPGATAMHHLLALHPSLDSESGGKNAIFAAAVERFVHTDPGTLGTWLVRHEQSALAADALENIAPTHPEAFIARLHALLREKQYEEADALLAAPPAAADAVEMELVQVAVARGRGKGADETKAWQRALSQAAFDTSKNRFIDIARFAEVYQAARVAEDAWVAAVRIGWGRLPLYQDFRPLFASLARQNRTHDLLSVSRSLLRYETRNLELWNNYHYLALLHDVSQPSIAVEQLERFAMENPESPELYSAACLAALMAGKPETALGWLHHLDKTDRVSPMMRRVLRGTALVLSGKAEEGREILKEVDYSRFLHQENAVFRKLLVHPQIAGLALPSLGQLPAPDRPEETPAWKKAVERLERDRAAEVLPALPAPEIPGSNYEMEGLGE